MSGSLYFRILNDINKKHYSIDEICSKFYVESVTELIDFITSTFIDSFHDFIEIPSFISMYHEFLYNLTDTIEDIEMLQYLSVCITKHINYLKEQIKPYNKKEKERDQLYTKMVRFKDDLTSNLTHTDNRVFNIYEDDKVKVLKHIIFDLKDLDALNNLITNHKEIVNIYVNDEEPFIFMLIRYYCDNIDSLNEIDLDYYKRVITMILLRDELKVTPNQFDEIKEELDYNLQKNKDNRHIKYLFNLVEKRINNPVTKGMIPFDLIQHKSLLDGRMDIRSLPTISIDGVKYPNNINMLFDDAFSLQEKEDGTLYLWMHIPDMDEYIPRDNEIDKYMHEKCESIYIKGQKQPMLPYDIASKLSLSKGNERLALSFRIHVDLEGKILNINYYKTVIKVDENFSRSKADVLIRDNNYPLQPLLEKMAWISKKLRDNRKETIGSRTKSGIIMDEYNIWANIVTASYFEKNGILFPFKNYICEDYSNKYLESMRAFLSRNSVDEDSRNLLYELVETKSRVFYSTSNFGNQHFNSLPYGNVGNPLREYISLETDRLIKDLVIDELGNFDYWLERIENDCVELSEKSSKVKELYKTRS